jgi:hypothetical protein
LSRFGLCRLVQCRANWGRAPRAASRASRTPCGARCAAPRCGPAGRRGAVDTADARRQGRLVSGYSRATMFMMAAGNLAPQFVGLRHGLEALKALGGGRAHHGCRCAEIARNELCAAVRRSLCRPRSSSAGLRGLAHLDSHLAASTAACTAKRRTRTHRKEGKHTAPFQFRRLNSVRSRTDPCTR